MKIIKGSTTEEQIKHIDTILDRFSRRLHKTTAGIITPYPISNFVHNEEVILRYMFPLAGKIPLGALFVENLPKSGIDVQVTISTNGFMRSETTHIKRKMTIVKPDLDVSAGTRLTIRAIVKEDEQASGFWISLVWIPEIRGAVIKQFLIDEIERVREDALSKEE